MSRPERSPTSKSPQQRSSLGTCEAPPMYCHNEAVSGCTKTYSLPYRQTVRGEFEAKPALSEFTKFQR
eukprot:scaffold171521_cov15-Prasinocladus_malaysianus.AAC.1